MTINSIKKEDFGFFGAHQLREIVAENRLAPCLIRCGGGRLTCPAQDVQHWITIIERDGSDYIRDISLL